MPSYVKKVGSLATEIFIHISWENTTISEDKNLRNGFGMMVYYIFYPQKTLIEKYGLQKTEFVLR